MLQYLLNPFIQVQDKNGLSIAGAKIYVRDSDTDDLATTYSDFEGTMNTNPVLTDVLGNATVRFMKQRDIVDFAVKWIEENRGIT